LNPHVPPTNTSDREVEEGRTESSVELPAIDDDALSAGDTITLSMGAETFSPVKYNPFVVGPFQVTIAVRKGETTSDALLRGKKVLHSIFREAFEAVSRGHNDRIHESSEVANRSSLGRG